MYRLFPQSDPCSPTAREQGCNIEGPISHWSIEADPLGANKAGDADVFGVAVGTGRPCLESSREGLREEGESGTATRTNVRRQWDHSMTCPGVAEGEDGSERGKSGRFTQE